MQLWFQTLLAGAVARSPLWLCVLWRFRLGIFSVPVIFLLWHFRAHNLSMLVVILFLPSMFAASHVFFSEMISAVRTGPMVSRMYLAARCLASACPPYVYWTTSVGYQFSEDTCVSAHAQATFLRSVAPSALSVTAQAAILRGAAEFLHKKLRDKKLHGVRDVQEETPSDPPTHFGVIYVPLVLYGSSSTYPPLQALFLKLVAVIEWPFVQIARCFLSPIVGSWHLIAFHTDETTTSTPLNSATLVSWPVRRHASV